jgi:hypothetical protein
MGKIRRFALLAGLLLCILALVILVSNLPPQSAAPQTVDNNPPATTLPDDVDIPEFVTPESPIGALGLVSAFTMSFALFYAIKRK